MDLDQVRERLWEQASEGLLFTSREEYLEDLKTWGIEGYWADDVMVGGILRRGPEFHFFTLGSGHPIGRGTILRFLGPQLERYGYVTTRTPLDDVRQHRFNRAFGFFEIKRDALDVHYIYWR